MANAGRRPARGPGRCCAGRRRWRRWGSVRRRRPARSSRRPAARPTTRLATGRQASQERLDHRPCDPGREATSPTRERERDGQRSRAWPPPSIRIASSRSRVVRISGRPRPGRHPDRAAPGRSSGHAHHRRVLDATRPARRGGGSASPARVPGGTRSGASAAVPTDSRGTTTSPSSSAVVVDGDRVEPLVDLERRRPRRWSSTVLQRRPSRSWSRVAGRRAAGGPRPRIVLGVDPTADRDVARRPARRARRPRPRSRSASPRAAGRPGSAARRSAGATPTASATRPTTIGSRGVTAAIIRGAAPDMERARRNLHDTWALMRSPPLVSFGPSGLPQRYGRATRPGQRRSSTNVGRDRRVIHRPSTVAAGAGQPAGRPVAGSSALTWPSNPSAPAGRRPARPR